MNDSAERVFLGLGSNLGERARNVHEALKAISEIGGVRIRAVSPVYESAPVGLADQPEFLNAAVEIQTSLGPLDLLQAVKEIERALDRTPGVRWGPREIDIDILLWGDRIIEIQGLRVPHERMRERRFVLAPLADIAAEVVDPETRRTIRELAAASEAQGEVTRAEIDLSV